MKRTKIAGIVPALLLVAAAIPSQAQEQSKGQRLALPYCVVDTGQKNIFNDRGQLLAGPQARRALLRPGWLLPKPSVQLHAQPRMD